MEPEGGTLHRAGILPVDTTVLSLVAVNVLTIVVALAEGWSLGTVIFIYWFQSLIIGFFTVIRLLSLDGDDLASWIPDPGVSGSSGSPIPSDPPADDAAAQLAGFARYGRFFLAGFFALHYGLFHFGYYTFLIDFGFVGGSSPWTNPDVIIACALFFANHLYSFLYYRRRDEGPRSADSLKELFLTPYARIVPMHITIMAAGFASIVFMVAGFDATPLLLVLFLGLKTYVDVRMHLGKHGGWGAIGGGAESAGEKAA
jgi:hypothetical protein